MKNSITIVVIIAIVTVLGIGAYMLSQKSLQSYPMTKKEGEATSKTDYKMMDDKATDSRYVEYSMAVLEKTTTARRVLFFYASWCPTCKPADANFKENIDKIPKDLTLIRVNYNDPETDQDEKDLAKKYGITYQHTFVQIDSKGKEITKWNGGQIDELLSHIN